MVQKINHHLAPECNRSPPYYVFSKDAILGSVPSISSEAHALHVLYVVLLTRDPRASFNHKKKPEMVGKFTFNFIQKKAKTLTFCLKN